MSPAKESHVKLLQLAKNPTFPLVTLPLGTMKIPARIVTDTDVSTLVTSIDMTAQFGGSAFFNGVMRAKLPTEL